MQMNSDAMKTEKSRRQANPKKTALTRPTTARKPERTARLSATAAKERGTCHLSCSNSDLLEALEPVVSMPGAFAHGPFSRAQKTVVERLASERGRWYLWDLSIALPERYPRNKLTCLLYFSCSTCKLLGWLAPTIQEQWLRR